MGRFNHEPDKDLFAQQHLVKMVGQLKIKNPLTFMYFLGMTMVIFQPAMVVDPGGYHFEPKTPKATFLRFHPGWAGPEPMLVFSGVCFFQKGIPQ